MPHILNYTVHFRRHYILESGVPCVMCPWETNEVMGEACVLLGLRGLQHGPNHMHTFCAVLARHLVEALHPCEMLAAVAWPTLWWLEQGWIWVWSLVRVRFREALEAQASARWEKQTKLEDAVYGKVTDTSAGSKLDSTGEAAPATDHATIPLFEGDDAKNDGDNLPVSKLLREHG